MFWIILVIVRINYWWKVLISVNYPKIAVLVSEVVVRVTVTAGTAGVAEPEPGTKTRGKKTWLNWCSTEELILRISDT